MLKRKIKNKNKKIRGEVGWPAVAVAGGVLLATVYVNLIHGEGCFKNSI